MPSGFYYNIYGPTMIGRAPSRSVHSVWDQALKDWIGIRKHEVQAILKAQDYEKRGLLFPVRPVPAVEADPAAAIISTYI
ncbi:MAG: hypothetical protein D6E12_17480 [Desulfovibrio sp.]|nr:MAG: hypothetical protein D6E12_17480 [Desulfovibrio sp.]